MQLRFTQFAFQELQDAIEYYEFQIEGLGVKFKESVDLGLKRIQDNPEAWEKYSESTRKYTIGKYPYKIIYSFESDLIIIIAIANSHRKPNYWTEDNR